MPAPATLISWIGDLDFTRGHDPAAKAESPLLNAIQWLQEHAPIDRVILLHSGDKTPKADQSVIWTVERVIDMTRGHAGDGVAVTDQSLDLEEAKNSYEQMIAVVQPVVTTALDRGGDVYFNGSSGRPIKHGAFMLLAATSPRLHLLDCRTTARIGIMEVPDRVRADIGRSVRKSTVRRYAGRGEPTDESGIAFKDILGKSREITLVRNDAHRYATIGDETILLLGETGTGKTRLARAIHNASARKNGPFKEVNCGAIPKGLAESELFGHTKNAATGVNQARDGLFRAAHHGTIFLDEVGELDLDLQTKLLKVLDDGLVRPVGSEQDHPVDVRVVAATHRDLRQMVADGTFRQDLWYRLAICPITVPPLRERGDDIDLIIDQRWTEIISRLPGVDVETLGSSARMALRQHDWKGNVRELEATLTRIALTCRTKRATEDDVIHAITPAPSPKGDGVLDRPLSEEHPIKLKDVINEVVGHYMVRAFDLAGGNKSAAARMLQLLEPGKGGANTKFLDWVEQYDVKPLQRRGIKKK